jgi:hypothetical protein
MLKREFMNTRGKDIFGALFWLLFAIYIVIKSYGIGLGKWSMPGPGYFPFGAALLFGIISLLFLIKTLRKAPSEEIPPSITKERWQKVVLTLIAIIVYVLFLSWIGFIICTFLLVVFFLRVVASQRWFTAIIAGLSVTLGAHLLFNLLLNAQLPSGIFTFLEG